MISRHLIALYFVVVGAFLVPGCGQAQGGACEIMADCASGLDCLCQLGGVGSGRGICMPIGMTCATMATDAGRRDTGPRADTGSVDGGPDGGPLDGGPLDGGPLDGGPDAASEDVGSLDATNDAPG